MKKCFALLTAAFLWIFFAIPLTSSAGEYGNEAFALICEKAEECGCTDVQDFIDDWLTVNAGTSEADWYALCISALGEYDFSDYIAAVESLPMSDMNAAERLRTAAVYGAVGGENLDLPSLVSENHCGLGVMSEAYALIVCGESGSDDIAQEVTASLLESQLPDGGWALSGSVSDADVTAIVLQAFSLYIEEKPVSEAVGRGLARLSQLQQSDGGFRSMGTPNAESCSQVITALASLGRDAENDAEFVKNGCSAIDALSGFRRESGGFSHVTGAKKNAIATVQACLAFTALECGGNLFPRYTAVSDVPATEPVIVPIVTEPVTEVTSDADETAETTVTTVQTVQTTVTSAVTASLTQTNSSPVTVSTETTQYSLKVIVSTTYADKSVVVGGTDDSSDEYCEGWKVFAYSALIAAAGGSLLYLAARKRLTVKRTLAVLAAGTASAAVIMVMKIQTPEQYYRRNIGKISEDSKVVALTVDCHFAADRLDGITEILPETEVILLDGDSAFDVLERAAAYSRIPLDYNGTSVKNAYITGIGGIYEMDFGEMSGWIYAVNGEMPSVGCGEYVPKNGDKLEFVYSLDLGNDYRAEADGK